MPIQFVLILLIALTLIGEALSVTTVSAADNDGPRVGETFRDCPECPEMVVVPAGEFMMGSPNSEEERYSNEGPMRWVSVRQPFAIGKYEVTFAEWDACIFDGGCEGFRPNDWRWGRAKRPVMNVSYENAEAYTAWLSSKTDYTYRLPSEAEWEYAARAGTTTRFHFGNSISPAQANFGRINFAGKTVSVGSYSPNAFGLHDVHGNVFEIVEDCWNENYTGAPSDSNAWRAGDCLRRGVRGGSWGSETKYARSAFRDGIDIDGWSNFIGFRIVRTLK
jgi:formylglycine-generating enzyme required for sulfatase activity